MYDTTINTLVCVTVRPVPSALNYLPIRYKCAVTALYTLWALAGKWTYVIARLRAGCLVVQSVDGPDVCIIVAIELLAVAALYLVCPKLLHLRFYLSKRRSEQRPSNRRLSDHRSPYRYVNQIRAHDARFRKHKKLLLSEQKGPNQKQSCIVCVVLLVFFARRPYDEGTEDIRKG